jgi:hypothetical protein
MRRRPPFATVVALLALFVALGGPAQAAHLVHRITSADVKDHSLKTRDLTKKTVKELRATPNGSITDVKIANGAVTQAKLAVGAAGTAAIADRSVGAVDLALNAVTGAHIANGTLDGRDVGRFYGRFQLANAIPSLAHGQCWSGVPADLPAERAKVDISNDIVLVTPDSTWPQDKLTFTVRLEPARPKPGRFALAACNASTVASKAFTPSFRYLIIHLP